MNFNRSLVTGSTTTLILKLLDEKDMYGYEMIETLAKKSDNTFDLKAGTLYPLLHGLEKQELVKSYEEKVGKERVRKYYHLTNKGKKELKAKEQEWENYVAAVNKVLKGGANNGTERTTHFRLLQQSLCANSLEKSEEFCVFGDKTAPI